MFLLFHLPPSWLGVLLLSGGKDLLQRHSCRLFIWFLNRSSPHNCSFVFQQLPALSTVSFVFFHLQICLNTHQESFDSIPDQWPSHLTMLNWLSWKQHRPCKMDSSHWVFFREARSDPQIVLLEINLDIEAFCWFPKSKKIGWCWSYLFLKTKCEILDQGSIYWQLNGQQ